MCCYSQPPVHVHVDVHEYNQHSYLYRTGYTENGKLQAD